MTAFSMNNQVTVYYDEKTTELIERHLKTLSDYETILWDKLKKINFSSNQDRVNVFKNDPTRIQIEKHIAKIQELSFPIRMEIVDFDKEE